MELLISLAALAISTAALYLHYLAYQRNKPSLLVRATCGMVVKFPHSKEEEEDQFQGEYIELTIANVGRGQSTIMEAHIDYDHEFVISGLIGVIDDYPVTLTESETVTIKSDIDGHPVSRIYVIDSRGQEWNIIQDDMDTIFRNSRTVQEKLFEYVGE